MIHMYLMVKPPSLTSLDILRPTSQSGSGTQALKPH